MECHIPGRLRFTVDFIVKVKLKMNAWGTLGTVISLDSLELRSFSVQKDFNVLTL